MADEKKKPGLAALVIGMGKPKAKAGADDGDGYDDESSEDSDEAASELYAAIQAKDEPAFKESLKAYVMSCK